MRLGPAVTATAFVAVAGLRLKPRPVQPASVQASRGSRPNVLILFVDDWGWGDMGANCLHASDVPGAVPGMLDKETSCDTATGRSITPYLDSIADSGIRFTDFHVGAAVCTPSRSALQTGRLGARTGVTSNFGPGSLGGLPLGELTIAEYLKNAPGGAYATAAVGKWHLGPQGPYAPTARGYDTFFGTPESIDYGCTDTAMGAPDSGCLQWQHDRCPRNKADLTPLADHATTCHPGPVNPWNYSIPLMLGTGVHEQPADIDGTAGHGDTPLSHRFAEFTTDFIRNATAAGKNFLVYLPFTHMHVPIVHSPQYTGKSGKGVLGDTLMELDDSVGMILAGLNDTKQRDNTIIFITGDNGPPQDQCDWGGSVGPFLGQWQKTGQSGGSSGKLTSWEGGHREVGVVSWPGRVKPGAVSHVLASSLDIVPTVLALAAVPLPTSRHFDGLDLAPIIFADDPAAAPIGAHHESLFFSVGGEDFLTSRWNFKHDHPGENSVATGLFQAIRLPGLSAMYYVGYTPQCCRGANGDANTPYNKSCSAGGSLGPHPTWLNVPLLFNLTTDVAQSTPLVFGTPEHTAAWRLVNASMWAMVASLEQDTRSHADYGKKGPKICCNPNNVVCRCTEL